MRDCVGIIVASNTLMDPCTAGQTLGGPDPCDPCGVDAYEHVYPKILGYGQNTLAVHPIS